MTSLQPEAVWQTTDKQLLELLNSDTWLSKTRKIRFYAPSFMPYKTSHYRSSTKDFPTISITGQGCSLKCKHCGGSVLNTMYPAKTPEELFTLCSKLKQEGALGCLISGGCLPDGSVPLRRFINTIGKIKHELKLQVIVHTGMIDIQTARDLQKTGVDSALIDVIGSDETIAEIYNLSLTVKDYDTSLNALDSAGIAFVPHVIVGLHYGMLKGEFQALKMISQYKPSALVVIAFMPIHGTEMENAKPPTPLDIARVIVTARTMFPETPLVLGCMRPKGKHRSETDILAIKSGVNAIAFPTEEAVKFAEDQNMRMCFSPICCSQIYTDMRT